MITSTHSTGFRGLIATGIFGALAASYGAVSAADSSSVTIPVNYADLDTASPSGALKLYARIEAAAHVACAYFWFKTNADEARCLQSTIANAVTKVNQSALTTVYNARFKRAEPSTLVSQSR